MTYLLVILDGILSPDSAALGFLEFLEFPFFFSHFGREQQMLNYYEGKK